MRAAITRALGFAVLLAALGAPWARAAAGGAGRGGHASPAFRADRFAGAALRYGRSSGLPPIAGVIRERRGAPFAFRPYGHTATAPRAFIPHGFGYGHVRTAIARRPVYGAFRRGAFGFGTGRRRRDRFAFGYGGYGVGGYGGFGYGLGGEGAPGIYGDAGVYGGGGGYGSGASGAGTTATQGAYGSGPNGYASEVPLAVRFAEPPLAPSPYAPYSPDDRYAYAASEDVGPGPRVIALRPVRPGCDCAPRRRAEPTFYRYGVGTAY